MTATYACQAQRGIGVVSFQCRGAMHAAFDVRTHEPVLQCDRCQRVCAAEPEKR